MSNATTISARTVILPLASALLLSACGSAPRAQSNRSVAQDPPPAPQTAATQEPVTQGPAAQPDTAAQRPRTTPEPEELLADAAPPMDAPQQDATPAEPEDDDRDESPRRVKPAELGRPDWWFNGVQRTDRVVRICAEAGGPTVREARRAAIDAARRKLALEVDLDPTSERVSLATVLPLPAADAGPDSAKYIGYVLMEVPAP